MPDEICKTLLIELFQSIPELLQQVAPNGFSLAAFAGLLCFFTLCNSNTGSTTGNSNDTQKQKNLVANELIIQAFETGDVSKVDSAVSEDFLDHTDRGDMRGRDSLKAAVKWVHENMKSMKAEKVRVVADEDYVYSWIRYTGTSDGTMGMPKGPYEMKAFEVSIYKDGKAVEHWNFMEAQDVMKMMPQPNMNNMHAGKKK